MTGLKWHRPGDQTFETGIDRGVLYPEDGGAVPWNGLISIENQGEAEIKELYLDGQKYFTLVQAKDWKGTLEAYTFPDEFGDMIGIAELGDGYYVDGQMPARFNLSYRTMINTPDVDDRQHYKIHLIYKATALLGDYSHQTLSADATEPTPFSFELSAIPQKIPGARPSAHVIIDTRKLDNTTRGTLEGMLYGNGARDPQFPTIAELTDLLTFSETVEIIYNGDGTWTARGSNDNIQVDSNGYFRIKNVNVQWIEEGVYLFLDGANPNANFVRFDEDGTPYFVKTDGLSNIGMDTDGVPFVDNGATGVVIFEDLDSVPYFELMSDDVV